MRLSEKRDGILTAIDYKKPSKRLVYAVLVFFLALAAFVSVFPIFFLFITSFKGATEILSYPYRFFPKRFDLENIEWAWRAASLTRPMVNSVKVVAASVIFSVLFNGLFGYVMAILKPKGHKTVFAVVMAGYMLPGMLGMFPLFSAIKALGLEDNWIPVALIFGANTFYVVMFKSYFESLPKAVFEAADIDGCGRVRMFFKMVIPMSWPIIGVICIFTATASWSDFLFPYLVLQTAEYETVMVRIYKTQLTANEYNLGLNDILMILSITTLPVIVLFLIFQRQITATATVSGIK